MRGRRRPLRTQGHFKSRASPIEPLDGTPDLDLRPLEDHGPAPDLQPHALLVTLDVVLAAVGLDHGLAVGRGTLARLVVVDGVLLVLALLVVVGGARA